jgi:HD superfamily phosphohydrolase
MNKSEESNQNSHSLKNKLKIGVVCTIFWMVGIQKLSEYMRDSVIESIIQTTCQDTSEIIQDACSRTDKQNLFWRILLKTNWPIHFQMRFTESQIKEALEQEEKVKELQEQQTRIQEDIKRKWEEINKLSEESHKLGENIKDSKQNWSNGDLFWTWKIFIKRFLQWL